MMRVAVIGLGIGKVHLQEYAANPRTRIAAVVDINPEARQASAAAYGVPGYASIAEMLRQTPIDAASVCTPPAYHAAQVEELAAAGVHALVEKPMAPTLADCHRMIEAARRGGVTLMIGQKKRFSAPYAWLKPRLGGEFGEPKWASIKYALGRVVKPWFWDERDGGGPLLENTIHIWDLTRFLMGEVATVYARGGNLFRPDVGDQIDAASATLGLANGGTVSVACGYGSEWGYAEERVSIATPLVCCDVSGPFDRPALLRYIWRQEPKNVHEMTFAEATGFAEEIDEFLDAIAERRPPAVTGEDAARSIAVALAAKRSIREAREIRV